MSGRSGLLYVREEELHTPARQAGGRLRRDVVLVEVDRAADADFAVAGVVPAACCRIPSIKSWKP